MPTALTGDDILDGKVGMRVEDLRVDVLDTDSNVIGQLHPQQSNGGQGTVQWDVTSKISRTWNGVLLAPSDAAALEPNQNRLRPWWMLPGYVGAQWPLGTFIYFGGKLIERAGGDWVRTKAMRDLSHQMSFALLEPFSVDPNELLTDALARLAALCGIANVSLTPSSQECGSTPLNFAPGDKTALQIAERITNLLAYAPVYFDALGTMRAGRIPVPEDEMFTRSYQEGERGTVGFGTVETDQSTSDRPNVFIVRSNSASVAMFSGRYYVPDSDPNSISQIKFAIPRFYDVAGLTSNDQAADVAESIARQYAAQSVLPVSFEAAADPRHDAYEIVNWRGTNMLETAWRLNLATGRHGHDLTPTYAPAT